MGLRELKKAKTRKLISDTATRLFMERGYAEVTTAEIAQQAEVSVTTLFKYFPTKESLVFDEDQTIEQGLVQSVKMRVAGTPIVNAVRDFLLESPAFRAEHEPLYADFARMIRSTPELAEHARQTWLRYEKTLAQTIEETAAEKISLVQAQALAHFILEAVTMAQRVPGQAEAFRQVIDLLRDGFDV